MEAFMGQTTIQVDQRGDHHQQKKSPLTALDAIMWREGVDRQLLTIVTNIAILDRRPDYAPLLCAVERATARVRRLRQVIRSPQLGEALPYLEDDPNFSLSNHIHLANLPKNATERDLLDLAAAMLTHTFSPELPMWSLTLVDGLEHDRAALIIKRHHALMDGASLARLVLEIAEQSNRPFVSDETECTRSTPESSAPVGVASIFGTLQAVLPQLAKLLAPAPRGRSSIMRGRSRARRHYMITRRIDDLREAAHAASATLNDVFLAGVALAMRAYHLHHDAPDQQLRVSLPVNIREAGKTTNAGNQIALIRTGLPLTIEDAQDCIQHFHKHIVEMRRRLTQNGDPNIVLSRLPSFMVARVCGAILKSVDVATTNVNCSSKNVQVAGANVVRYATFSELCGAALNITLYRYGSDVTFGITVDPAAIPDPDFLRRCFERAFDQVTCCKDERRSSIALAGGIEATSPGTLD
jgi:diacylglycerol O-acyltransferase / wax synthase